MSTQTPTAKKANNEKTAPKVKDAKNSKTQKDAIASKEVKKEVDAEKPKNLDEAKAKISKILTPNVNTRINRLETFQIKVDKFKAVSEKYDELTNFMAGNDSTNANMKFASASNYGFTLRNPVLIDKILGFVEAEFSQIVEKAENEVLEFEI
ncbi:hypothetical protein [Sediminibacter sp. Hel_I_10]|uniref:hypothetical protein n=1 Tax=Sediminibacter sp. Hel_I_10 TaxID=1392490 RepID=UPI00047A790D|nr:hypothetical protein [Sediminibacter sp. Hel_I_10]